MDFIKPLIFPGNVSYKDQIMAQAQEQKISSHCEEPQARKQSQDKQQKDCVADARNDTAPTTSNHPSSAILDRINTPADMKSLTDEELKTLADDLRRATVHAVSKTGGHLGAGLGVVELTTAIHAVFDTPHDRLIWDVGHQCYPHKILTGRKDRIETIRQPGGLSGFTKRSESEYDPFGAGHSSTSISAGLGMSIAHDLKNAQRKPEGDSPEANYPGNLKNNNTHVVCVIGDGAMSAGQAFEAMNNAGIQKSKLIVILNDNEMSIAPPTGALARYLTRTVSSRGYITAREIGKKFMNMMPSAVRHAAKRAEEGVRVAVGGGSLFEEMGFYYIGPVDGHNIDQLLAVLRNAKAADHNGPILIHAITQKGKGFAPAENAKDKMHGVKKFDVITGDQVKSAPGAPSYTSVFASQLIREAEQDDKIVAITAAMPDGTGLDKFAAKFPTRMFDVGIAEQHAVTFAAGLASEGFKPFCAIYSTFLQRAYDQVVHDVAIQNLPVRFMIDRAGLVGADGATHAGSFDIAYLGCLPNMTLMAAADADELEKMVSFAAAYNDGPLALRYPRGESVQLSQSANQPISQIQRGKGRIVHQTQCHPERSEAKSKDLKAAKDLSTTAQSASAQDDNKRDIAILSYGTRLEEALKAAKELETQGKTVTIADARFAKPLDTELIYQLATTHSQLITIEEGSIGGFGSYVLEFAAREDLLSTCGFKTLHLPDVFQDHNTPDAQYEEAKLTAPKIIELCS